MGSQFTLVIERSLREIGHRSVVLSPAKASKWAEKHRPKSVIHSGSSKSVYDTDAPHPPANIVSAKIPTLGICYGMQRKAKDLDGNVQRALSQIEYGPAGVQLLDCPLFAGIAEYQQVWASHGDTVLRLPEGVQVVATDAMGEGIRAMHVPEELFWGVQFHPEVSHTTCGKQILKNFVETICGCKPDWEPANIVEEIRKEIGADKTIRAILGFSGGVDSTTMAAILAPVMGDRLLGVCIDGGQLRMGEIKEIKHHANVAGITLKIIKAKQRFLRALRGITDAEKKRKAFKRIYLSILKEVAAEFRATHIVQGTLAPDLIESGATGGHLIKSHHNVGLDWGNLGELMPLSPFFKYEVRALAEELDLPLSVVDREPFPGPGLFIRIIGSVTAKRLAILSWADCEVRKIVSTAPNMPEVSQMPIGLNCTNIVGVKGDGRAYGPTVVVRPVKTTDYMTVESPILPEGIMRSITSAVTKHLSIVGVWWDYTPKPPRTTEFE